MNPQRSSQCLQNPAIGTDPDAANLISYTNYMELNSPWQAIRYSNGQEISHVYYRGQSTHS